MRLMGFVCLPIEVLENRKDDYIFYTKSNKVKVRRVVKSKVTQM